jgi:serine/threonine-protein kinase
MMQRVAETLAGRYELVEVIGRGGMGVVHRGRDRVLDRTVAVKVLPALFAENPTLVERFEREARAAARLSHPNIVSVYDSGRDGTERYFVMEYVPGKSLAELLRERGRLPVAEAVGITAQIANALAAAHGAGIIHRDIKPGNVMVLPSGEAKVLDFGIARAAADVALTRTTMVLGSAPYIAPEVALGRSADQRSDIYSLGCVLYEMLTGRPPFVGDLPAVVMSQHTNAEPQPPRELVPEIPAALEALVLQMLAKNPADRPQQAAELPATLRSAQTELTAPTQIVPGPAPTLPAHPPTAPTEAQTSAATPGPTEPVARRRPIDPATARRTSPPTMAEPRSSFGAGRAWLIALALLLALAAGVAVALVSANSGNPSSSTSRSSVPPTSHTSSHSTSHTSTPTSSTQRSTTTTTTTTTSSTTPSTSSSTSGTSSSGSATVTVP